VEGDLIKTYPALVPLSWVYGGVVRLRNWMFNMGIYHEREFPIPIIGVGNITVGGCGKTPHVEYLTQLLSKECKVAVLSRGYKRKSRGYVLADEQSTARQIGDEPMQIHLKYLEAYVVVDKDRCHGIMNMMASEPTDDVEAIILDDAYQHRYVKPGLNILLIDYHRLITSDKMLPAGRLRESAKEIKRADIVIVTKCPNDLTPMNYRVLTRTIPLLPYQSLFFTSIVYGQPRQLFGTETRPLESLQSNEHIMLIAGIASPEQIIADLKQHCFNIHNVKFSDHHQFTKRDVQRINREFELTPMPRLIITTEKDAMRLRELEGLSDEVKKSIYVLPIEIKINLDQEEDFNEKITDYVRKNSRKIQIAKSQNFKIKK